MIRMLVSVRNVSEALQAADAGADLIDLKDPGRGALGGLDAEQVAEIVTALRAAGCRARISATIGDLPAGDVERIVQRVRAMARCGVDDVKVGIWRDGEGANMTTMATASLLRRLAQEDAAVVPVFVADAGVPFDDVAVALRLDAFAVLMLDTFDKRGGSLLARLPADEVNRFVQVVRAAGSRAGLAGSLGDTDLSPLRRIAPDIAGFRGAVCCGDREGALEPARVRALLEALHAGEGDVARGARPSPTLSTPA